MTKKQIGAAAFERACLRLLDEVAPAKTEIIITKRGRPVARVVPMQSDHEREHRILGALRGKGKTLVPENELLCRSSDDATWSVVENDV